MTLTLESSGTLRDSVVNYEAPEDLIASPNGYLIVL